jgi:pimeloyl-ACP methyl ester carboxylesterase
MLRPDVGPADLLVLFTLVYRITVAGPDLAQQVSARALGVILDGLRTRAGTPLPGHPSQIRTFWTSGRRIQVRVMDPGRFEGDEFRPDGRSTRPYRVTTREARMTVQVRSCYLDVPGGRLYYEVRGSGLALLVIGQPMTADPFGPLADLLAEDHTVITYDPHGLGRSTIDDPSVAVTPEMEADDLAAIVEALGSGRVDVFGSSGGAVAGLAFAARHPDRLGTLIAHEPPVTELLPDAAQVRAAVDEIEDAYRGSGTSAAWGKFVSLVMHRGAVTDAGIPTADWPPAEARSDAAPTKGEDTTQQAASPEPSAKQAADDELFFLRMLEPFTRYEPPIAALRSGASRIVVAVGATSSGEIAVRSAEALAELLGTPPAVFPGDHGGFMADPAGFATKVREVLAEASAGVAANER